MEDCHYCEISTHIPQEFTFTKVGKWIYDDWHPSESLWFNIWWRWWWGLLKDTVSSWRTILRHLLYGSIGTFLGVGFRCLLSKSLECGQLWWCAWSKRIFSSGPCFPPSNDDEFIISPPDNHPKQDIARHCLYWGMHLYLGPWRDVRPASNEWNPSFFSLHRPGWVYVLGVFQLQLCFRPADEQQAIWRPRSPQEQSWENSGCKESR